jgi:hypothetical protein
MDGVTGCPPNSSARSQLYRFNSYDGFRNQAQSVLTFFERQHIVAGATLDQSDDVSGHDLHDVLILIGISVPVVDAADAAVGVIENAIHGLSAKPQPCHGAAEGASQIMWRGALASNPGANSLHCPVDSLHTCAEYEAIISGADQVLHDLG